MSLPIFWILQELDHLALSSSGVPGAGWIRPQDFLLEPFEDLGRVQHEELVQLDLGQVHVVQEGTDRLELA